MNNFIIFLQEGNIIAKTVVVKFQQEQLNVCLVEIKKEPGIFQREMS